MNEIISKKTKGQQKIWWFCLINIMAFNLNIIYWYYKNDINFRLSSSKKKSFFKALGILVPILGPLLFWEQLKSIKQQVEAASLKSYRYPGWITLSFAGMQAAYKLPSFYSLLGTLSFIPLIIVQLTLNRYWMHHSVEGLTETPTWLNILLIIIFVAFWLLLLIRIFISPFNLPP